MGERIDGYCVLAADKSSLPWQACAAALVWFISAESSGEAQRGPP
jgi:hypothetical protein